MGPRIVSSGSKSAIAAIRNTCKGLKNAMVKMASVIILCLSMSPSKSASIKASKVIQRIKAIPKAISWLFEKTDKHKAMPVKHNKFVPIKVIYKITTFQGTG